MILSVIIIFLMIFTVLSPILLAGILLNVWYMSLYAIIGIPLFLEYKLLEFIHLKKNI